MPRIGVARAPAVPVSPLQRERCARMLAAAARLGATHGLDHVQMTEVARCAGVALGTLYRYYPSKHHLFAALMSEQVSQIPEPEPRARRTPSAAVAELMAGSCHAMLRRPLLARAMLVSINVVRADSHAPPDHAMRDLMVRVAGIEDPSEEDLRLARLVEQCTYGVLTWAVAGELTADEAVDDIRRACLLLLAPWNAPRS